jgi:hypothetical protein
MNVFKLIGKGVSALFGSSDNGKGIVGEISDTVDRWSPSAQTLQENSIEDLKAGDASQESARGMKQVNHESWVDIFVDAMNRLPRPLIGGWVICILFGWVEPTHLESLSPLTMNIVWTVVTFWFGSRVVFKDIPKAIAAYKRFKS